jgi:hypothetical protein
LRHIIPALLAAPQIERALAKVSSGVALVHTNVDNEAPHELKKQQSDLNSGLWIIEKEIVETWASGNEALIIKPQARLTTDQVAFILNMDPLKRCEF